MGLGLLPRSSCGDSRSHSLWLAGTTASVGMRPLSREGRREWAGAFGMPMGRDGWMAGGRGDRRGDAFISCAERDSGTCPSRVGRPDTKRSTDT